MPILISNKLTDSETDIFQKDPLKVIRVLLRLAIWGISLGVISGTLITIIPKQVNKKINQANSTLSKPEKAVNDSKKVTSKVINKKFKIKEKYNIKSLSKEWLRLANTNSDLEASAYILFDDGRYAEFSPNKKLSAASTIKVGILLVTLEKLDQKAIQWDELLILDKDSIAGGSGWMRYQKIGKKFPLHEIATEMIRISDNTATNLLIKRLGGIEVLNKRFKELGLLETEIKNLLPDLSGKNKTSAKDLANTIQLADRAGFLSKKSRDIFREIMSTSTTNTLIPDGVLKGLGIKPGNSDYKLLIQGFKVYNKTGDIGITYADSALIQMPDTSRAVVGFIVKGPFNDQRSTNLIRNMSASIIPYLKSNP